MKWLVCQITRGMAPAVSIAATVQACAMRRLDYRLIAGKPAAAAKQQAAQMAFDAGCGLLLCEDDFLADSEVWDAMLATAPAGVSVCSALMRNGQLNSFFLGSRLVLSGSVFLAVGHDALTAMGAPWFEARDLHFDVADGGKWTDMGPNARGERSDVFFFSRCWACGIEPVVAGFVTHLIHPQNSRETELLTCSQIIPMGMMSCKKTL
jgi:hypothetical protein